ncbi:hypothetical protein L7F22_008351 [Adiantum nelumboides]|nr:hypothetical protein [Adiantum nelumboides]
MAPSTFSWALVLVLLVLACVLLQDPRKFSNHPVSNPPNLATKQRSLWTEKLQLQWKPCAWWKDDPKDLPDLPSEPTGYIKVECMGGLNQMRRDLCDGVGIARLLNASLLIPHFDAAMYWNDTSGFADIFDVDFFIRKTKGFVQVVKELPQTLISAEPFYVNCRKQKTPFDYIEEVLPLLRKHRVIRMLPAASQRSDRYTWFAKSVRCEACYGAIRIVKHLEEQAKLMMKKLPRPFLTLHLRFEPDMIAYSQCAYPSLSKKSMEAVKAVCDGRNAFTGETELSWRKRGKCLLTPGDVAFILHALHIPKGMPIYIATGDELLEKESFTSVYTNTFTKSSLLDEQSLKMLKGNSKAAIDYYIAVNSDYYIATFFGNMEKMVLPMRVLRKNYFSLVLNKKEFGNAVLKGLNSSMLRDAMWQYHRKAFVTGRGLALPDCFCEEKAL